MVWFGGLVRWLGGFQPQTFWTQRRHLVASKLANQATGGKVIVEIPPGRGSVHSAFHSSLTSF